MSNKFIYCTYITLYRGNKMPPFYIGSSTVERVENGYRGSVSSKLYKKIWRTELKENPQLFKTKIISVHETRIDSVCKEEFYHRILRVTKSNLYINMAFANKGFDSTLPEIRSAISAANKGRKFSEAHKISLGGRPGRRGQTTPQSTRDLMSKVRKNSPILTKISIDNLPPPQKGILNGMHKSNRNYDSDKEKNRIKNIKISKENRTKEQNVTSYSRVKSLEEIQKMKESMKNRRTVYISRLSDRKVMGIGNYTKWLKTL